ncbi:MAG: HDIG domain-containing protein [Lentimicrobium sp.]|jgi:putative nucleotidyltransferase with HDIG domain|nr:HDIG domain-containing protein [Lentimicrobium sp.]
MNKFLNWLRNHYDVAGKGLLFAGVIVLLIAIFPREGKFRYEYQRGKAWQHDDLIAPVDFGILKTQEELNQEKALALKDSRPYFSRLNGIKTQQSHNFEIAFNNAWDARFGLSSGEDAIRLAHLNAGLQILDTLFSRGIIGLTNETESKPPDFEVFVVEGNTAFRVPLSRMYTIAEAGRFISDQLNTIQIKQSSLLRDLLMNALRQNIVFDAQNTRRAEEALVSDIPVMRGMVQAGEKVITRGEIVNGESFRVLESLRADYESRLGESFKYNYVLTGQSMLIAITMIAFILFMISFRRDIFAENKKLIMLLLVILVMVSSAAYTIRVNPALLPLLPFALVPIVIRVFFDTRLAFFVHVVTLILTGFMVPNGFEFLFQQLIAGIIAIISVAELRKRSQFFLTALAIFITYVIVYIGMLLIQDGSLINIRPDRFLLYGGSAMFTLFSYPLIFLFEKLFSQVTDVTLMELSDTNSPLLRKLSLHAPGTFQHSMQVANIGEAAIYEIGGNTLLIRAGALYHDIGKMDMPMYFIENQTTGINPHDELGYEESARIIIGHVTKGIEMAKKHKLPEILIDFIRTHHGTRVAEYFYNRQRIEFPEKEADDKDFRYPGPLPYSKETSVLMMADSVEAASRSLEHHTIESIDTLVESIIDRQIEKQQFVNAELTLKDITKIKKILKKKLMSIYHVRIAYPEALN